MKKEVIDLGIIKKSLDGGKGFPIKENFTFNNIKFTTEDSVGVVCEKLQLIEIPGFNK